MRAVTTLAASHRGFLAVLRGGYFPLPQSIAGETPQPPHRSSCRLHREVLSEEALLVRLHRLVGSLRREERIAESIQCFPTARPVAHRPDFHQDFFERPRPREVSEDEVEFSHNELEHVDFPVEQLDDIFLDRVPRPEVHDVYLARLSEAMDSADSLLDLQRIPGEVVVHHGVAELEVPTLTARFRAEEDPIPFAKRANACLLLPRWKPAVIDGNRMTIGLEPVPEIVKGPEVLGEHDDLVIDADQQLSQPLGLCVFLNRRDTRMQLIERKAVLEREVPAVLHPPERFCGGKRAAPDLLLEHKERQRVWAPRRLRIRGIADANKVRDIFVDLPLGPGQGDFHGEDAAGREYDHTAPSVPDHHLPEEALELRGVRRRPHVASADEALPEATRGAELAGPKERDEVEKLFQVVLNRRSSQEEHVLLANRGDKFPIPRVSVLEFVGFINDDNVVCEPLNFLLVDLSLRRVIVDEAQKLKNR